MKKTNDYGEIRGYLCKITKHDINKKDKHLTNYPPLLRLISSSRKLEETLDKIVILTDKTGVELLKNELNSKKIRETGKELKSFTKKHICKDINTGSDKSYIDKIYYF